MANGNTIQDCAVIFRGEARRGNHKRITLAMAYEVEIVGCSVVVKFNDGHEAVFVPYSHGFGYAIEGLTEFYLSIGGKKMFGYHSRLYRCGPCPNEHRIHQATPGYGPQVGSAY
jgi:hypothetical protein